MNDPLTNIYIYIYYVENGDRDTEIVLQNT